MQDSFSTPNTTDHPQASVEKEELMREVEQLYI